VRARQDARLLIRAPHLALAHVLDDRLRVLGDELRVAAKRPVDVEDLAGRLWSATCARQCSAFERAQRQTRLAAAADRTWRLFWLLQFCARARGLRRCALGALLR